MERYRDQLCFGCGEKNPIGLHMKFTYDENGCYSTFVPQPVHQSYDGRMQYIRLRTALWQ